MRSRRLRTRPELADQRLAARADEMAEDKSDDDRVVELAGHGDTRRRKLLLLGLVGYLALPFDLVPDFGTRGSRASRVTSRCSQG
jgi:hypothetical protein